MSVSTSLQKVLLRLRLVQHVAHRKMHVCWSGCIQVATTRWHVGKEFDAGVVLAAVNLAGLVSQWAECVDVPNQ